MKQTQQSGLRRKTISDIYLIAQTMMWGLSFIVMKNITAGMPATAFLAMRFVLAALVLLPFFVRKLKDAMSPGFMKASAVLGALLFFSMGLQVYGLERTSVTNSAFITSTNVLLVPIFERLLFRKKLSPALWTGCIVAFAGVAVLSGGPSLRLNIGDVLTALCAIGFSLQIIFAAKYAAAYPADTLGYMQLVIAAALFAVLWGAEGFNYAGFEASFIPGIVFMAVINTAIGFVGQVITLKYVRPTVATLIFALEPIFATMFALVIPGADGHCETLTLKTGLGALAVLAGVILALVTSLRPGQRSAENHPPA